MNEKAVVPPPSPVVLLSCYTLSAIFIQGVMGRCVCWVCTHTHTRAHIHTHIHQLCVALYETLGDICQESRWESFQSRCPRAIKNASLLMQIRQQIAVKTRQSHYGLLEIKCIFIIKNLKTFSPNRFSVGLRRGLLNIFSFLAVLLDASLSVLLEDPWAIPW